MIEAEQLPAVLVSTVGFKPANSSSRCWDATPPGLVTGVGWWEVVGALDCRV